ncbi:MAG TPA: DNA alkylation repair protein [Selenomonadales bacterium]|nr:DNA alkylation repair protein [Selenomonadales bacterium]
MERLIALFQEHRDPANAAGMAKYMRDQFPYLGIKAPERRLLLRQFLKDSGLDKGLPDRRLVLELWKLPEREYQYAAVDYLVELRRQLTAEDTGLLQGLITGKAWWDTVDPLATVVVGDLAGRHPHIVPETIEDWSGHENLWLRRTAILFQLKYKARTDTPLLYRFILRNAASREFFIQKAIGWALREYSKTDPESVRAFIRENALPRLSVREGGKYL